MGFPAGSVQKGGREHQFRSGTTPICTSLAFIEMDHADLHELPHELGELGRMVHLQCTLSGTHAPKGLVAPHTPSPVARADE